MVEQASSAQVPSLQQLETGVCDFLVKQQAGTVDPFDRRIEDVGGALQALAKRLGNRYARATLTSFDLYDDKQRAAVERLTAFAENMPDHLRSSGGLLLYGPPGTGKDHLLAALLKIAVARHKLDVLWYDGGDLFDEFYVAIKADDSDKLRDLQKKLRRPHILAISDPQPPQGPLSDSQIRRLRDLIDARYRFGLSTWITTNLDSRADTIAVLTDPVRQRLKEGSAVVDCNWPSYRERKVATW